MREQPGRLTERLGYVPVLKLGHSEVGRVIGLDPKGNDGCWISSDNGSMAFLIAGCHRKLLDFFCSKTPKMHCLSEC
jgi:hypothetical protein